MSFNIQDDYALLTDHFPNRNQRPIIGITGNFGEKGCELAKGYYRSIEDAGGIPVVLPPAITASHMIALLERIDGLLLSGGADINPLFFNEEPIPSLGTINSERDRSELLLTRLAFDRQVPIFGICRGVQTLTLALGGSVWQDLEQTEGFLLKHSQDAPRDTATHYVDTETDSLMQKLLGVRVAVNSFHHQAVRNPGPRLRVTGRSSDGVIEAVESNEMKSIIGVQWHPETFILSGDKSMQPLFSWFVYQCESFRRARSVHRQVLTLDSHTDTPMFFGENVRIDRRDPKLCVDLHKMQEGMMDAVVMAAYLPQGGRSEAECAAAVSKAADIIRQIKQQAGSLKGVELASTPKDIYRLKGLGKRAIILGVENGYAIGRDIANIEALRQEGVVYMTLCHNGDNDICDSAMKSTREHGGLSSFGREVVKEMNRTGMLVDLSHASEETFYDVVSLSSTPPVCTHSSSRELCNHPRNLTDDQLRALAERGGVAQATFYAGFLREDGEATIADAVAHIVHMIDVAGIDHVGIGSDFDGDGGVLGLRSEAEMLNLTRRLLAEGLNVPQLRKLWGGNFIRVMGQAQRNSQIFF